MSVEQVVHTRLSPGRFTLAGLSHQLPTMISIARHTTATHPDLQALHDALIEPFVESDWRDACDYVSVTAVADGSREAEMSARTLDWGYCSHYHTGNGAPALPAEEPIPNTRTYTLAAHIGVGEAAVVLGTLQIVVGETVPALSLFAATPGTRLPHDGTMGNGLVGELRRFSVSPLFDVVPLPVDPLNVMLRDYRRRIYRELYMSAVRLFRALRVRFVYGVATPEIYRFFTKSGQPMRRVDGAVLVESEEVRELQRRFAGYWRPGAPVDRQPALYEILLLLANGRARGARTTAAACRASAIDGAFREGWVVADV
jgi:hypothetical protein